MTQRRALQGCILLAGCVPVFAGFAGMVYGPALLDHGAPMALESHFRYLSGLLCGLGLCFWRLIPIIERSSPVFGFLCAPVILGGFARLGAALFVVPLSAPDVFALVMELIVTPSLFLWQRHLAKTYSQ